MGEAAKRRTGPPERGRGCGERATPSLPHIWGKVIGGSGTGENGMTDTATMDGPEAKPARRRKVATATATQVAEHLGVSRQYIVRLADEGTIERLPDGRFDQDKARLAYLSWLRDPARRAVKGEAESKFLEQKTLALTIRNQQRLGELWPRDACEHALDVFVGTVIGEIHTISARAAPVDIVWRRKIDAAILTARKAIHARLGAALAEFNKREGADAD